MTRQRLPHRDRREAQRLGRLLAEEIRRRREERARAGTPGSPVTPAAEEDGSAAAPSPGDDAA